MIIEIVDIVFILPGDNLPSSSSSNLLADHRDLGETVVVVIGISATVVIAIVFGFVGADVNATYDAGVADVTVVVVVGFSTQIRSDVRLPFNEMYSFLLHCFQFVQLVPIN